MEGHGQGAGDRRRRHHQQVRAPAPFDEGAALRDPEPVLLVHDGEAEVPEPGAVLDQGMRADDELRPAARHCLQRVAAFRGPEARGEQHDPDAVRLEKRPDRREVLLGKDLGGGHERHLRSVMDDDERRDDRHDRLPGTHVTLEQPPHGEGGLELLRDRGEGVPLRRREAEGQHPADEVPQIVVHGEGVPARPVHPVLPAAHPEPEGEDEELLQDEPLVGARAPALELGERGSVRREVHRFERLPSGRESHPPDQLFGELTGPHRSAALEQSVKGGAQEPRRQGTHPFVDGHDPAGVGAGSGIPGSGLPGCAAGVREKRRGTGGGSLPLAGHQFVTGVRELGYRSGEGFLHLSEQQHPLSGSQDLLQMDLVEPGRLHRAARVVPSQFDDAQVAPPGGAHAERRDQHLGRGGISVGQLGDRTVGAPVLVAEGQPQQQVAGPDDPDLGERGRPPRTHAGEEPDLGVRGDSGQGRLCGEHLREERAGAGLPPP